MAKKKDYQVQLQVLQNGSPVSEASCSLEKNRKLSLNSKLEGELSIPLYPLVDDIPIVEIHKGSATLTLEQAWSGFVVSQGEARELSRNQSRRQRFPLKPGDYASLLLGDLRVLLKLSPHRSKNRAGVAHRRDPRYRAKLFSLVFREPAEQMAMMVAIFFGLAIMGCVCFALTFYSQKPPRAFEELADSYTLPFINSSNLATAPEALQEKLDRRYYIPSVVAYYRNMTKMIMGWPVDDSSYLFSTSRQSYDRYYEAQSKSLQTFLNEQREADRVALEQKGAAMITIPSVYGESFQQRLLRTVAKINHFHEGLELSLKYRRQVTEAFRNDPQYDWTNYLHKREPHNNAKANAEIAKISVFNDESNEAAMYTEARLLAERATNIQNASTPTNEKPVLLARENVRPIYIPAGVSFASFISDRPLPLNDGAIKNISASAFGKKAEATIKEPLVGQVDPNAIRKVVYGHRFQLNFCYESALRRNQSLAGSMDWSWRIDSLGKISDISLVKTTLGDQQMIDCVRSKVASWIFPHPHRGSVKVLHTFAFKPQSG